MASEHRPHIPEHIPELDGAIQKFSDAMSSAALMMKINHAINQVVRDEEEVHGARSRPDGTGPYTCPLHPLGGWIYADAANLARVAALELPLDAELDLDIPENTTWRHVLLIGLFRMLAARPDLEDHTLDHELTMISATVVMWIKDRARRRDAEVPPILPGASRMQV